jgi:hypothetical protein
LLAKANELTKKATEMLKRENEKHWHEMYDMIHNKKYKHGDNLYYRNETISFEDRIIEEADNFGDEVMGWVGGIQDMFFYMQYFIAFDVNLLHGLAVGDQDAFKNAMDIFDDDFPLMDWLSEASLNYTES